MHLDLDKLTRRFEFALETSIGEIKVGSLGWRAHQALTKRFPSDATVDSQEYVRFLVSEIAKKPNGNGKELRALLEEELSSLTEADLDAFASAFIEKNKSWLYHDYEYRDEKGDPANKPIDLPKEPGESTLQYLRRLLRESLRRSAKHNREILRNALPKNLFSNTAASLLAENSSLSKTLTAQLEAARRIAELPEYSVIRTIVERQAKAAEEIKKIVGDSDFKDIVDRAARAATELEIARVEARRSEYAKPQTPAIEPPSFRTPEDPLIRTNQTLEIVASQISTVAAVSSTSADLLRNMNELGLTMAKTSSEHAGRVSRQNRWLIIVGLIAVGITAIGIVISTGVSISAYLRNANETASSAQLISEVAKRLEAAERARAEAQRTAETKLAALETEVRALIQDRIRLAAERDAALKALAEERQRQLGKGVKSE